MRHRWKRKDGYATCMNPGCGIRVKEYRIKRGGITPCHKMIKEQPKLIESSEETYDYLVKCKVCGKMIPDTIFCVYCAVQRHPLGWLQKF